MRRKPGTLKRLIVLVAALFLYLFAATGLAKLWDHYVLRPETSFAEILKYSIVIPAALGFVVLPFRLLRIARSETCGA